jgi:protein SCO1/2
MKGQKNTVKLVFLSITLLVPIAIYLFLRFFGHNQFDIPIYYSEGIPADSAVCVQSNLSHFVDLSRVSNDPNANENLLSGKLSVIALLPEIEKDLEERTHKLSRIASALDDKEIFQIVMIEQNAIDNNRQGKENLMIESGIFKTIQSDIEKMKKFAICQLVILNFNDENMNGNDRIVLIDDLRRIRGYYRIDDFDDMDRLILEVKILTNERNG